MTNVHITGALNHNNTLFYACLSVCLFLVTLYFSLNNHDILFIDGVPDAPNITLTSDGVLRWTKPDDNGASISRYILRYVQRLVKMYVYIIINVQLYIIIYVHVCTVPDILSEVHCIISHLSTMLSHTNVKGIHTLQYKVHVHVVP